MAKTDYSLDIDSVRGELKRGSKNDLIEILAFEHSASVPHDMMTGQASGKRRYSDVTFEKLLCKADTGLQQLLATRGKIKTATLKLSKVGPKGGAPLAYYIAVWTDAYISSYRIRGQEMDGIAHNVIPRVTFTLNFRKVEIKYTAQGHDGETAGSTQFGDEINTNS